jgi:hypothetical protein
MLESKPTIGSVLMSIKSRRGRKSDRRRKLYQLIAIVLLIGLASRAGLITPSRID